METVDQVTFKPEENITCASVPVVDDNTEEPPEDFGVSFGSNTGIPGLRPGPMANSTVTILDDDEPGVCTGAKVRASG